MQEERHACERTPFPIRKICLQHLQHLQILMMISALSGCAYSQTFTILANLNQVTGYDPVYVSLAQGTQMAISMALLSTEANTAADEFSQMPLAIA
jgi:hypothetical protein